MAGPNEDDHKTGKQTGTRPKSRSRTNTSLGSTSSGNQSSALLSLMREYQAVTDSLALARDQIEREGQRMVVTRGNIRDTRDTRDMMDSRTREIESLRSRLLELESEVTPTNTEQEAQSSVSHISLDSDNFFTRLR